MVASVGDGLAVASGGLVLLDRRVYSASTTWTKPADGAGNLLAGVGKIVVVRQQGGGGGGATFGLNSGAAGGTTSFGSHCNATGGAGGVNGGTHVGNGGDGSLRSGFAGDYAPYINNNWKNIAGGGAGARINTNSVRGGGGWSSTDGSGSVSSAGEGGESLDVFKISDLASTVTVTIGAGGVGQNYGTPNNGGSGWMIVEVWGVLS